MSKLKPFVLNDVSLFPHCELQEPQPIITANSLEEYAVQEIIDSRRRGRGWQYWVRWTGYGPEHDRWLSGSVLEDCEALDIWLRQQVKDLAAR